MATEAQSQGVPSAATLLTHTMDHDVIYIPIERQCGCISAPTTLQTARLAASVLLSEAMAAAFIPCMTHLLYNQIDDTSCSGIIVLLWRSVQIAPS